MEITAAIIVIKETQVISEKFKKREFVLEVDEKGDGQWPQKVMFELVNEKCDFLDQYKIGDVVKVSFNLRGREWQSPQGEVKYFNTLQAWRISIEGQQAPAPQQAAPYQSQPMPQYNQQPQQEQQPQQQYHQAAPVQQDQRFVGPDEAVPF